MSFPAALCGASVPGPHVDRIIDLFTDTPRHLAELRDLGRWHPAPVYRRLGFVVTGVMPDADGPGKPDIYMSKPIRRGGPGHSSDS